jgi:4-amino-4-deoxy-L-arabinose transferase-like glycosyltransferase
MSDTESFTRRHEKLGLLLLVPLCYALFFHQLGNRDLWSPDEDEYVQVNVEMVRDGHWIYPTANGQPYSIKPPLFNWIGSGIAVLVGEVDEWTSRLPSALAATLGLFALYPLGVMLFGRRAAALAVLVLATTPLYIEFGRWIQINMISTALLTVTLCCFTWGYTQPHRRTAAYLLMYAAAGLGTLDMGLVNAVMPAIVIGLYLLAVKDLGHLWQLRIVRGLLVYLAVVAPWYATVSMHGGYARDLVVVTNFTRYFTEWQHTRPFYYYMGTTPAYFLPWVVFLPGAFYLCFARRTGPDRKRLLLPFVWTVSLFVFFSISRTKRSEYMLPIYPALALLVGYTLDRACRWWADVELRKRLLVWPTLAIVIGAAATAVGVAIAGVVASVKAESAEWFLIALPFSILALAGAATSWILLKRGRGAAAVASIALFIAAGVAYGAGPYIAKRNEDESAKPFCLEAQRYLPPGENLNVYQWNKPMLGVYTERFIDVVNDEDELLELFESDRQVFIVMKDRAYKGLEDSFPHPLHVVLRNWIDHRFVLLLSNRPVAAVPGGGAADANG